MILEKLKKFVSRQGLGAGGLVVAVSGGPDSVALFSALVRLRTALGAETRAGPLVVAHLNHLLRGDESDEDERFVGELVQSLCQQGAADLQFQSARVDVAAQAQRESANLENTARRIRYAWLTQVAQEAGLGLVATGHTADDQAETVLHRLLRGTGLRGLSGIAARRPLAKGIDLVRPLLSATRQEILADLQAWDQAYRQDSSNLNLDYTRNRLRHELLPLLSEHYNPAVVAVLNRLAAQAAEVYQDLEAQASARLAQAERPRAGPLLVLDRKSLSAVPRHLLRELFRIVWTRENWPEAGMGFCEWDGLADLARGAKVALDLPGGIRARCRDQVILIGASSLHS